MGFPSIMSSLIVQSAVAVAVAGDRLLRVPIRDNLRSRKGVFVRGLVVEATIELTNGGLAPVTVGDVIEVVAQLVQNVQHGGLHTVPGTAMNCRGLDLLTLDTILGWRSATRDVDPTVGNASNDFPSFGAIAGPGNATRVVKWVIPFGIPNRGKYADDTSPAVGDLPDELAIQFISDAALVVLTAAGMSVTGITVTVAALVGTDATARNIARPLVVRRTDAITVSPWQTDRGQHLVDFLRFGAAQGAGNPMDIDSPSDDNPASRWTYRGAFALLADQPCGNVVPGMQCPPGTTGDTVTDVPIWACPFGALSDMDTSQLSYLLGTPAAHSLIQCYIAARVMDGRTPAQQDAERADTIARNEGAEPPAHVAAKIRPGTKGAGAKVPFKSYSGRAFALATEKIRKSADARDGLSREE